MSKVKLVFSPPDKKTDGYLLRAKKGLEFKASIESGLASGKQIDDLVEFLLPYVKEPADRNEAREALLLASEEEFLELVGQVSGADTNPTPPEPSVTK